MRKNHRLRVPGSPAAELLEKNMRLVLITIATILLLVSTAFAESTYDEVPRSHWAYGLFDYIINDPSLKLPVDYPADFFQVEERALTRHEFAMAIEFFAMAIQDSASDSQKMLLHIAMNEFGDRWGKTSHKGSEYEIYGVTDLGYIAEIQLSMQPDAYADVPPQHWAYDAMQHFVDKGTLEGYPEDFFNRDRVLTGYEFAQATARLLDTINHMETVDPCDNQIIEILRSEFSFQLAFMNAQLDEFEGQIQWLDASDNDAE
jgi:hypothetical protein